MQFSKLRSVGVKKRTALVGRRSVNAPRQQMALAEPVAPGVVLCFGFVPGMMEAYAFRRVRLVNGDQTVEHGNLETKQINPTEF
jgi:hypothetical protein